MEHMIDLWRPDLEVAEKDEMEARYEVEPFDLYGRRHVTGEALANIGITRLPDGVHLELSVRCDVDTTCDRTLEPVELPLEFSEMAFLSASSDFELSVENWVLDLKRFTERALPAEVPLQVFAPGTEPVLPRREAGAVDPRWRGLDGLFASGF
ncbi:MAG: hypothetical protein H0V53_08620 [Rubrobacter sp.]|nr:hypothetical protein [Rubrobacter sp.]